MIGTEEVLETCTISEWAPHLITHAATIELITTDVSCNDSFTCVIVKSYPSWVCDWRFIGVRRYP